MCLPPPALQQSNHEVASAFALGGRALPDRFCLLLAGRPAGCPSSDDAMSSHPRRVRLKPWLVAQVNSGQYPGLRWVDGERKRFFIPWRHATRHIPSQDDENTIFKAWAKETGKYNEGVDEPDPAKWKANLRCALNKSREFNLIYDGTKDTPMQAFKIYEVCDAPQPNGESFAGDENVGCEEEEELQKMMPTLQIADPSHGAEPLPPYPWLKQEALYPGACANGSFPHVARMNVPPPPPPVGAFAVGGEPAAPNFAEPARGMPLVPGDVPMSADLEPLRPGGCPVAPMEQFIPDLLISPHMLPRKDPNFLLNISRSRPLSIGLIMFQKGQSTTPPPYEIFFCFGEEWPDQKPKEKKLITVQVVPVAARLLLEMFSGELCWSADSVRLQISHPDLKDKMVEQFKELHQLWQTQQSVQVQSLQLAGPESWPMQTSTTNSM
nr:interferon regulatory factor 5 [Zootoca vivipara]